MRIGQIRQTAPWIIVAIAILAVVWFLLVSFGILESDNASRAWLPQRYAAQLRAGNGLVANVGERALLTPSPAYVILLAVLGTDPTFFLALLLGAWSLFHIARQATLSRLTAFLVAVTYLFTAWPVWMSVGTALPVIAGLSLLGLNLALAGRWFLAGPVLSLAILSGPEAVVSALVLAPLAVERGRGWRYAAALGIPLGLALVGLSLYCGPSFLGDWLVFRPVSSSWFFMDVTGLFIVLLLLLSFAAIGWFRGRTNQTLAVAGAWIALHFLILVILLPGPLDLRTSLMIGPTLLLAFAWIEQRVPVQRPAGYALITLLGFLGMFGVFLSTAHSVPRPTLEWFNKSQQITDAIRSFSPDSVGFATQSDVLWFCESIKLYCVSFDGQLQPALKALIERNDLQSALIRYAPDLLVPDSSSALEPEILTTNQGVKRLGYVAVNQTDEQKYVFRRSTAVGQFVDQPVNADFGPDIRLVGAALDQPALKPGQLVRVRLDWQFARPATRPVTVELRLSEPDREVASAADEYEPRVFRAGPWSTYHTLTVAPDAASGPAQLFVSVIVNNGTVARQVVARIDIKP